jgi:hypothetical protein
MSSQPPRIWVIGLNNCAYEDERFHVGIIRFELTMSFDNGFTDRPNTPALADSHLIIKFC